MGTLQQPFMTAFDLTETPVFVSDVVVLGSGIAGLAAALEASKDFEVTLLTKGELRDSATSLAQGGVATAWADEDSPELHYEDTIAVGAGLCVPEAVSVLVNEGPHCVEQLLRFGADFDWLGDRISLAREGGHSLARVLHSGDATGSEIETTLIRVARRWRSVELVENVFAVDLMTEEGKDGPECFGVLALKEGRPAAYLGRAVILATGGAGQTYSVTTNPPVATGDGIAMAYRAGAQVRDLEFVQFHPTALAIPEHPRLLITEALRGEGAYLVGADGERFMGRFDPRLELAPRDVVARAALTVMQETGSPNVFLDGRHLGGKRLKERFPTIFTGCLERGFDLSKELLPVAPAAHYTIGGVTTDLDGRTTLPGLWACGEVASSGVHGANRLASNSLLEGLVFARRICRALKDTLSSKTTRRLRAKKTKWAGDGAAAAAPGLGRSGLQEMMTRRVGLLRDAEGLSEALSGIVDGLPPTEPSGTAAQPEGGPPGVAEMELANMRQVAALLARMALEREESRGVHFRLDWPAERDEWKKHSEARGEGRVGL